MIRKGEAVTAPRLEGSVHSPSPIHQPGSMCRTQPQPGSMCRTQPQPSAWIHQLGFQLPGRTQSHPSAWIREPPEASAARQDTAPAPAISLDLCARPSSSSSPSLDPTARAPTPRQDSAQIHQPGLQLPGRTHLQPLGSVLWQQPLRTSPDTSKAWEVFVLSPFE